MKKNSINDAKSRLVMDIIRNGCAEIGCPELVAAKASEIKNVKIAAEGILHFKVFGTKLKINFLDRIVGVIHEKCQVIGRRDDLETVEAEEVVSIRETVTGALIFKCRGMSWSVDLVKGTFGTFDSDTRSIRSSWTTPKRACYAASND